MPDPSFIGIDFGGTQLRAASIATDGSILASRRVATDRVGVEAVIAQMDALVTETRQAETRGIGIGIPGAFDAAEGSVLGIPALPGWTGIPLAARLGQRSGLPVALENDAKAAALGEWQAGAGKGYSNFAYVTIGTGIGGGIVVEDRLVRGFRGLAGEVGHTRVTDRPVLCDCGRRGCWQAVAAGPALARAAQQAVRDHPASRLAAIAGPHAASGRHVDRAARERCPVAVALLDEEAGWLAVGFVNIQHLYAPERIVVGGGVSQVLDLMRETVLARMAEGLLPGHRVPDLVPASLGDDAGLVGAAMVALEAWRKRAASP